MNYRKDVGVVRCVEGLRQWAIDLNTGREVLVLIKISTKFFLDSI